MRIFDYENGRQLYDVELVLTEAEVDDLYTYLEALRDRRAVSHVHLSEVVGRRLERELTVSREISLAG